MRNSLLEPTKATVRGYSGEGKGPELAILGRFKARLSKGNKTVRGTRPRKSCVTKQTGGRKSGPDKIPLRGNNRHKLTRDWRRPAVPEYKDVFTGIGKLKGVKVKMHVDPNAKGVVQRQRRISIQLKDKFDKLLSKWEEMDIIEDVGNEPTVWCSNVVITPNKDGESLRAA